MTLLSEISSEPETKTIIFVETKRRVDEITRAVCRNGWRAVAIHGKFPLKKQNKTKVINFTGFPFGYHFQATKLNKNVITF